MTNDRMQYSSGAIHPREASEDQKIHGSELFRTSVRWPPTFQVRKSHRLHFGSRMSDILFRWMLATRTCWNDKMVSTSYVDISISIYCIPLSTSPSEGLYHYSSPPKSDKIKTEVSSHNIPHIISPISNSQSSLLPWAPRAGGGQLDWWIDSSASQRYTSPIPGQCQKKTTIWRFP